MKIKNIYLLLLTLVLVSIFSVSDSKADLVKKEYEEKHVLARLKKISFDQSHTKKEIHQQLEKMLAGKKMRLKKYFRPLDLLYLEIKSEESVKEALDRLNKDSDFDFVEANYFMRSLLLPNDTHFASQTGLFSEPNINNYRSLDVDKAWDFFTGSSSVIVSVIDSGIHYAHEDINDNMWDGLSHGCYNSEGEHSRDTGIECPHHGWDFFDDDNDPMDFDGHGTNMASIIGAEGNNEIGITGINWDIQLMAVKTSDIEYHDTMSLIEAIYFSAYNGAKVLNMSLGGSFIGGGSRFLFEALEEFIELTDGLIVTGSGNEGLNIDSDRNQFYPCEYNLDSLICVGGLDRTNRNIGRFSNYSNSKVDIVAPSYNQKILKRNYNQETLVNYPAEDNVEAWTQNGWVYEDYTQRIAIDDYELVSNDLENFNWDDLRSVMISDANSPYASGQINSFELSLPNMDHIDNGKQVSFSVVCNTEQRGILEDPDDYVLVEMAILQAGENFVYFPIMKIDSVFLAALNSRFILDDYIAHANLSFFVKKDYQIENPRLRFRWFSDDDQNNGAGCAIYNIKLEELIPAESTEYDDYMARGTSNSSAFVSGAAALLMGAVESQYEQGISGYDLKELILSNAVRYENLKDYVNDGRSLNLAYLTEKAIHYYEHLDHCGDDIFYGEWNASFCNPSFESSGLPFWSLSADRNMFFSSYAYPQSGKSALHLELDSNNKNNQLYNFEQNQIYLDGDHVYKVSFWYHLEDGMMQFNFRNSEDFGLINSTPTIVYGDNYNNDSEIGEGFFKSPNRIDESIDESISLINPRENISAFEWKKIEQIFVVPDFAQGRYEAILSLLSKNIYLDDFKIEDVPVLKEGFIDHDMKLYGHAHWKQIKPSIMKNKIWKEEGVGIIGGPTLLLYVNASDEAVEISQTTWNSYAHPGDQITLSIHLVKVSYEDVDAFMRVKVLLGDRLILDQTEEEVSARLGRRLFDINLVDIDEPSPLTVKMEFGNGDFRLHKVDMLKQ